MGIGETSVQIFLNDPTPSPFSTVAKLPVLLLLSYQLSHILLDHLLFGLYTYLD